MAERTDFLYPFIDGDERDVSALLTDLAASARGKAEASMALRDATLHANDEVLADAAHEIAGRLASGGRIFTFGNGGSSADAASLAALFARPPYGRAVPARCLVDDIAVLTALANDIGFELVFARQLIAHARPGDIAIGISTSGMSRDVVVAFEHAIAHGILSVGIAGYDGGAMASGSDWCLVVSSDSVHRIQEAQGALACDLWSRVQGIGEGGERG